MRALLLALVLIGCGSAPLDPAQPECTRCAQWTAPPYSECVESVLDCNACPGSCAVGVPMVDGGQ
jgi:hypothetical protein